MCVCDQGRANRGREYPVASASFGVKSFLVGFKHAEQLSAQRHLGLGVDRLDFIDGTDDDRTLYAHAAVLPIEVSPLQAIISETPQTAHAAIVTIVRKGSARNLSTFCTWSAVSTRLCFLFFVASLIRTKLIGFRSALTSSQRSAHSNMMCTRLRM